MNLVKKYYTNLKFNKIHTCQTHILIIFSEIGTISGKTT